MADFAPLGRAHHAGLTDAERREIVVQHERLFAFTGQAVDDLRVAAGAEGRHHQCLGFAAGKERRTVGSRQHARANSDRTDRLIVASVDTRKTFENSFAYQSMFKIKEFRCDFFLRKLRRIAGCQCGEERILDFADRRVALLLFGHCVRRSQILLGKRTDSVLQIADLFRYGPGPLRLAGFRREFLDRSDRHQHLFMAERNGAEHDFFIQAVGLGFHHQHPFFGAGDHEIELRFHELRRGRIENVVAAQVSDARCADRPHERHPRDGQRRGGAEQRCDIRIHFRVDRQHRGYDLHVVGKAVRKQRTNRTIDQARRQSFLLGGPSFPLEETAGYTPRRVSLFLIIDRQRKEVAARRRLLEADCGDEHHCFAHRHEHRAVGLTRQFARLNRYGVVPILKTFLDSAHVEPLMSE